MDGRRTERREAPGNRIRLTGRLVRTLLPHLGHLPRCNGEPPQRWAADAAAVQTVERKAEKLLVQVDAHRELSSSLAHDDVTS
jgi:hypothetical protein